MEHNKKTTTSSSSSFTMDLFGPKDSLPSSSSSTGIFGSVFGPPSTGLGKDSSGSGAARRQDFGSQYGNAKQGIPEFNNSQRKRGESGGKQSKGRSSTYQNETSEPSYLSSSIYYGGQEVYPPNTQTKTTHHAASDIYKDHVGGDDSHGDNSNSASRGNWWEGSLYY